MQGWTLHTKRNLESKTIHGNITGTSTLTLPLVLITLKAQPTEVNKELF